MKNVIPVVMAGGTFGNPIAVCGVQFVSLPVLYYSLTSHILHTLHDLCVHAVIGIYGLIIAVILAESIPKPNVDTRENVYSIYTGMAHVSGLLAD